MTIWKCDVASLLHTLSAILNLNTYSSLRSWARRDFRIMRKVGSVVDKLSGGWLNVRASIEQFSHTMAEQARLDVEGYHLSLLNHNFRAVPMVAFPRTIYATQSIIIETFETGDVIGDMFRSGER